MEPASKKRRLAPKADSYSIAGSHHRSQSHQNYYQNERQEFEAFARHLQDAAMQIQRQTEPQPYTEASVLLLSWQDDDAAFNHVSAVDQVFQSHFGYRTQRWSIPTYANPSLKLGVRLASFLQNSEPNQLLIVYYAGHGFVGTDGQVYWARDSKPDAARLKWNGLRCIFEDAAPDVLLLLDTCFVPQPDVTGSNGTKQIITSPAIHGGAPGMFTPYLVEALRRLSVEGAFTAKELHDEVCARIKAVSPSSVQPIFVNLARDSYKDLVLTRATTPSQNGAHANGRGSNKQTDVNLEAAAQLRFDEARVLVCTTFVGDGNANMEHFNFWVQHTPPLADVITLEAMFLGPPTMLLISMPTSVWNVVQHDKVCIFLGYISSHNMLDMYEKLLGSHKVPSPSPRRVEEEMISPTAHEARDYRDYRDHHDPRDHRDPRGHRDHREHREYYDSREQREHREYRDYRDSVTHSPEVRRDDKHQVPRVQHYDRMMPSPPQAGVAKREDAPESPEITEAAEQLKSLSHTRHRSSEHHHSNGSRKSLPGGLPTPSQSHHHPPEGTTHESGLSTPGTHTLDFPNKHDVRCNHCSHLPFKDISSLRKHIAAAHTRPFPCAFSFAGCNSTFGSKNEWKRHIASQHLCLQYYRCSACPYNPNSPDSRGNEFNRKDLFTQHLRRMHAPLQIKRAGANGDAKVQAEWDAQVKDMQHSCLVTRRKPPQQSACPKPGCGIVFDGASAWDDWTEHVGRHMEKGEGDSIAPDGLLIAWALREGIVDRRDGIYKLVAEQRSPAQ